MRFLYGFFILFFCMCFLCGCSQIVENYADDLTLNSWSATQENGNKILLKFNDKKASLNIITNSELTTVTIEGNTVYSVDSFVITDETMGKDTAFKYKITGKTLELFYNDYSIILNKDIVK